MTDTKKQPPGYTRIEFHPIGQMPNEGKKIGLGMKIYLAVTFTMWIIIVSEWVPVWAAITLLAGLVGLCLLTPPSPRA